MATRTRNRQVEMSVGQWDGPELEDLDLEFSFGESVLSEFVSGHDVSGVLRELVQNEFDAKGTKVEILFGENSVLILGNGKPIDAAGWKRLSVMLGKGQVAGSDRVIEPKINGIGSKNFGLRSLFLLGDRIFVRSGGRWTILDISKGTLPKPRRDPESKDTQGIRVEVPFRDTGKGGLEPFGQEREEHAVAAFFQDLIPTLVKLAQPNSPQSLRELVVSSERCNRRIKWSQSATRVSTFNKDVVGVQRQIRVTDSAPDGSGKRHQRTVEEIEFQKYLDIPTEFENETFPSYFKVNSGRRLKIGVSLRKKGQKIDLENDGVFFYPIGVANGHTGNAVSINAPFQMNVDRSQILDKDSSSWNAWLLKYASDLTMELLTSDWLRRFGADAYLAVNPSKIPASAGDAYSSALKEQLSELECWPTRERLPGRGKGVVFSKAGDLVIPDSKELDGFLQNRRYLDQGLAERSGVLEMAKDFGAKSFGLNSLVRLRCADKDGKALATKLNEGEANIRYKNYVESLGNVDRQGKFAQALDALSRKLTRIHKEDLRTSVSTLTAAGTLDAPSGPLWVVDEKISSLGLVPPSKQLHPQLHEFKSVASLCVKFDIVKWIKDVAERSCEGTASSEEREALYQHIIGARQKFDQKTKSLLRKSPVLKDHQGHWVAPAAITGRGVPGASFLEPVLHFPYQDYASDPELGRVLGFRKKVDGDDLVSFAKLVAERSEHAERFEDALWKLKRLLSPQVIRKLSNFAFVRNSLGGVSQPDNTYLRTQLNGACLGQEAPFVVGDRPSLYKQLRCREMPRSEDILKHISALRERQEPPANRDVLYTTLVEALRTEKKALDSQSGEEILWLANAFHPPAGVLIGPRHSRVFLNAVPQVVGATTSFQKSAQALGAFSQPQPRHWLHLLRWYAQKYEHTQGPVSTSERLSLREAYKGMSSLPEGISKESRILLDQSGLLHALKDAEAGTYLIDDDPQLSYSASKQGISVSFADHDSVGNLPFFTAIGVDKLTEVRRLVETRQGAPAAAPARVNVDRLLSKIHSPDFASAVCRLAEARLPSTSKTALGTPFELLGMLRARSQVGFVEQLEAVYMVAGQEVVVPEELAVEDERFVTLSVSTMSDLRGRLSGAIANLVTDDIVLGRGLSDSIFRLLACSSSKAMERYLQSQGIPWSPSQLRDEEAELEEWNDEVDPSEGEVDEVTELVLQILSDDLTKEQANEDGNLEEEQPPPSNRPKPDQEPKNDDPQTPARQPPPIDEVNVQPLDTGGLLSVKRDPTGGGGRGTVPWMPPTREQEEWERAIGHRGEEIVYKREVARIKASGGDESKVVWVSQDNPGSDFDINSIDGDGKTLWIEVKSTSGSDGRFRWSKAEFDRARKHRNQYILYRVYEAGTRTPSVKEFRDPVGLLLNDAMRLNVSSLYAEVESLDS